jgi:hypothetical protein
MVRGHCDPSENCSLQIGIVNKAVWSHVPEDRMHVDVSAQRDRNQSHECVADPRCMPAVVFGSDGFGEYESGAFA